MRSDLCGSHSPDSRPSRSRGFTTVPPGGSWPSLLRQPLLRLPSLHCKNRISGVTAGAVGERIPWDWWRTRPPGDLEGQFLFCLIFFSVGRVPSGLDFARLSGRAFRLSSMPGLTAAGNVITNISPSGYKVKGGFKVFSNMSAERSHRRSVALYLRQIYGDALTGRSCLCLYLTGEE